MALFASRGESGMGHRCGCSGEILLMARQARGVPKVVIIIDVAVGALARRIGVATRQRKSDRVVIELRAEPVVSAVATVAGQRKLGGGVIGIDRRLVIRGVAGVAVRGHGLELAVGRAFVTGVTIDGRMRTGEWEAIVVLLNLLDRHLPSPDRVALFAVRSELALVNVRMAILAALADAGEHRLDVALHAGH